jgi:menaquinone-dependent protoporphyrinogen oxidase
VIAMNATGTGKNRENEPASGGEESRPELPAAAAATEAPAPPRVLVAYASKHGATQGIAENIAKTLQAAGLAVVVRPVTAAGDPADYDACVVGSAAYFGSWLAEAAVFVRENRGVLASRPVWLFSSGPIGRETTDAEGRDVVALSVPKEIAEFEHAIRPRGHRVFFGKVALREHGFLGRLAASLPASWMVGVEGDFRDWAAIGAWAEGIARELTPVPAGGRRAA